MSEAKRPYVVWPVGFRQDEALSPKQFCALHSLHELGVRRFADRSDDTFQCRGSELEAVAGMRLANALRHFETIPKHLARVEPHPERDRVWIVTLPGFREMQGIRHSPASARRAPASRASTAADRRTDGERPARYPPPSGPSVAGGADRGKPASNQPHSNPSPSSPSTPTSTPPSGGKGFSRSQGGKTKIPAELPPQLSDYVRTVRVHQKLSTQVQAFLDSDDYLNSEYQLFRSYHARKRTTTRDPGALFVAWLRNVNTATRAHIRVKADFDGVAANLAKKIPGIEGIRRV